MPGDKDINGAPSESNKRGADSGRKRLSDEFFDVDYAVGSPVKSSSVEAEVGVPVGSPVRSTTNLARVSNGEAKIGAGSAFLDVPALAVAADGLGVAKDATNSKTAVAKTEAASQGYQAAFQNTSTVQLGSPTAEGPKATAKAPATSEIFKGSPVSGGSNSFENRSVAEVQFAKTMGAATSGGSKAMDAFASPVAQGLPTVERGGGAPDVGIPAGPVLRGRPVEAGPAQESGIKFPDKSMVSQPVPGNEAQAARSSRGVGDTIASPSSVTKSESPERTAVPVPQKVDRPLADVPASSVRDRTEPAAVSSNASINRPEADLKREQNRSDAPTAERGSVKTDVSVKDSSTNTQDVRLTQPPTKVADAPAKAELRANADSSTKAEALNKLDPVEAKKAEASSSRPDPVGSLRLEGGIKVDHVATPKAEVGTRLDRSQTAKAESGSRSEHVARTERFEIAKTDQKGIIDRIAKIDPGLKPEPVACPEGGIKLDLVASSKMEPVRRADILSAIQAPTKLDSNSPVVGTTKESAAQRSESAAARSDYAARPDSAHTAAKTDSPIRIDSVRADLVGRMEASTRIEPSGKRDVNTNADASARTEIQQGRRDVNNTRVPVIDGRNDGVVRVVAEPGAARQPGGNTKGDRSPIDRTPIARTVDIFEPHSKRYITGAELAVLLAITAVAKDRTKSQGTVPSCVRDGKVVEELQPALSPREIRFPQIDTGKIRSLREIGLSAWLAMCSVESQQLQIQRAEPGSKSENQVFRIEAPAPRSDEPDSVPAVPIALPENFGNNVHRFIDESIEQEDERPEKLVELDANVSNQNAKQSSSALYRPTHLITSGETLNSIAEAYLGDARFGWLLVELNRMKLRCSELDEQTIVEIRARERLELPVAEDIQRFRDGPLNRVCSERLVTLVVDDSFDEVVNLELSTIWQGDRLRNV